MSRIKNLEDLKKSCYRQWSELDAVRDYLNDAGRAKSYVLSAMIYNMEFVDSMEELYRLEGYTSLFDVKGMNQEYYRVLNMIDRVVKESIKEREEY